MRCTFALLGLLCLAATAHASSPSLTSVRPTGAQRGAEVVVDLTGARLGDAKEILFYQPGIAVAKLETVHDTHVRATLKIDAAARLGIYDFRLRTATGLSELRTFNVGPYRDVAEVEPNNDFARPQAIGMDVCVNGLAENEDADYYAVKARKGERISAEVEGIRLGVAQFDPYVAILDEKRFELATSDDAALVWQDAVASVVAPADGTYIIMVRESAYAGNASCVYRLQVGHFPRARATVPSGGKAGEEVAVRWIGDVLGEATTKVKLPEGFGPDFQVLFADASGPSPHPNAFRISPYGNVVEVEPNETQATATAFTAPAALNGVIDKPGDQDQYVFTARKGQAFDVNVFARRLRSPLDSVLLVARNNQGAFVGDDDAKGPDSYVRFTAPDDGEYVLLIKDHLLKGGPDYSYRIEVAPVAASLALSVPSESIQRGTGAVAVAVPRGNRQAVLVNAARADFGGDLAPAMSGLPPGVAFEADAMNANLGTMPVLLTASADAAPAGSLATLSGRPVDPKVVVPSVFSQAHELVLGANNVPVWVRTVDRLAVAVTDEAPYAIDVVEPKAPLVRGGSMALKVVARRKPGFTAPISVYLPWNPPGVGSQGGVAIPENGNEAVISINADGTAMLATWKVVVHGDSNVASGPIRVSSQLAKLTIAAPYLGLTYRAGSVEQGQEVDLLVKVAKAVDWDGPAQVTLIGLPNKATTDAKTITKDTTELVFRVKTDKATPAGNHNQLFCQVVVPQAGEAVQHNIGTGQLRVDVPLPPKANAPARAPTPVATATPAPPPQAAPPKPLTRLEKLRKEHEGRAEAAGPAGGGK